MQEPFDTVPLIWIIQEDTLATRLPVYEEMGLEHLVSHWKSAFTRANVIVFPDFTLPVNLTFCLYLNTEFSDGLVLDILCGFLISIPSLTRCYIAC